MIKLSQSNRKRASFLAGLALAAGPLWGQEAPPPAVQPDQTTVVLDPFHVQASSSNGYGAADSSGGSRVDLPIIDVPMSLDVIPRALMDDLGSESYYNALLWVSSMNPGSDIKNGDMVIRGIEVRAASFSVIDGLPSGFGEALQETNFIDRYEVVKGPAGTLYGDFSVGGLVNRILKMPTSEPHGEFELDYGSFGTLLGVVDSGGPIDSNRQFQYRVVALDQTGEEVTRAPDDKHGVYSVFQYIPKGTNTTIYARGSWEYFLYNEDGPDDLIDVTGTTTQDIGFSAREAFNQGKNTEDMREQFAEFGVVTTSDGELGRWSTRFLFRYADVLQSPDPRPQNVPIDYTFYGANGQNLGTLTTSPNPPGVANPTFRGTPWTDILLSGTESYWNGPNRTDDYAAYIDINGSFDTGPLHHDLLVYGSMYDETDHDQILYLNLLTSLGGSTINGNYNPSAAFSIVHPQTWQGSQQSMNNYQPWTYADAYAAGNYFDTTAQTSDFAAGLQDNIFMFNNRLLFVGGVRYDYIQNPPVMDNFAQIPDTNREETANWSHKESVVIKPFPNPGIAIFANYAQTFTPEFGFTYPGSGVLLKNLLGIGKEIGVKLDLFNSKLLLTASYFHNVLTNNPVFYLDTATGRNITVQNGTANFPGWDADATWQITKNINLLLGGSDINSTQPNGEGFRNTPIGFEGKFLARYAFSPDMFLKGLAIGAGLLDIPQRYGSNAGYYNVPGYREIDCFATYAFAQHWHLQLNANNVNNAKGILSALGQMAYNGAVYPMNYDFIVRYKW